MLEHFITVFTTEPVLVGIFTAFIAAALAFLRLALKTYAKPVVEKFNQIVMMAGRFDGLVDDVNQIKREMSFNSGSTIKDIVSSIESSIQLQDHRHWALLENVNDGVVEMDADGKLVRANRTFMRWVGRAKDELVGEGWKNTIYGEDLPVIVKMWESAVNDSRDMEAQFRLYNPIERKIYLVSAMFYRLPPAPATVIGWIGNIHCVSEAEADYYGDSGI